MLAVIGSRILADNMPILFKSSSLNQANLLELKCYQLVSYEQKWSLQVLLVYKQFEIQKMNIRRNGDRQMSETSQSKIVANMKEEDGKRLNSYCRILVLENANPIDGLEVSQDRDKISHITKVDAKITRKDFRFTKVFDSDITNSSFTRHLSRQIACGYYQENANSFLINFSSFSSPLAYSILNNVEEECVLFGVLSQLEVTPYSRKAKINAYAYLNEEFYSLETGKRINTKENLGSYNFEVAENSFICPRTLLAKLRCYQRTANSILANQSKNSPSSYHVLFRLQISEMTLAILDLAVSEKKYRSKDSSSSSLLVLGRCLQAYHDNILLPFRQNKLTKHLIEYFGPKYKIITIGYIHRSVALISDNMKVLDFISLKSNVQTLLNKRSNKYGSKRLDNRSKSCDGVLNSSRSMSQPKKQSLTPPKDQVSCLTTSKVENQKLKASIQHLVSRRLEEIKSKLLKDTFKAIDEKDFNEADVEQERKRITAIALNSIDSDSLQAELKQYFRPQYHHSETQTGQSLKKNSNVSNREIVIEMPTVFNHEDFKNQDNGRIFELVTPRENSFTQLKQYVDRCEKRGKYRNRIERTVEASFSYQGKPKTAPTNSIKKYKSIKATYDYQKANRLALTSQQSSIIDESFMDSSMVGRPRQRFKRLKKEALDQVSQSPIRTRSQRQAKNRKNQ